MLEETVIGWVQSKNPQKYNTCTFKLTLVLNSVSFELKWLNNVLICCLQAEQVV